MNVSHLRSWECDVWVKDLDHVNGKLGCQGWRGKLLGYMGRRGYWIYDPRCDGVYEVRDVIFEEGIGHCTRPTEEDPKDPPPTPQMQIGIVPAPPPQLLPLVLDPPCRR